jgi:glucosamine-6-phosphate deaminase
MHVHVSDDPARPAADQASASLKRILSAQATARILVATGNSQLRFLELLVQEPGVDWSRVELFHLDEYIGIGRDHPASFARYIYEKVIVPTGIQHYHLLDGHGNHEATARALASAPIDLAFAGIGENGHLAFNDPPADFETEDPYLIVDLDEACRRQQVGEGWFPDLSSVPTKAITISIRQLMKAAELICVVPDQRKARAVSRCLEGEVSPETPASILRQHPNAWLYLDRDSASSLHTAQPVRLAPAEASGYQVRVVG